MNEAATLALTAQHVRYAAIHFGDPYDQRHTIENHRRDFKSPTEPSPAPSTTESINALVRDMSDLVKLLEVAQVQPLSLPLL
jgi:hypothetical protein